MFGDPTGFLANQMQTATLFLIFTSCFVSPLLFNEVWGRICIKKQEVQKRNYLLSSSSLLRMFLPLTINALNNKWYCETCKQYREIHRKTSLHPQGKLDRNIKYVIGAGTILLCAYVIQTSIGMTFFEKISAIIGIILGTTLAFLSLKLLFSNQKTTS